MATIKPFAALRPLPEVAPQICEPPYDVVSAEEARAVAAGNHMSFFHVSRPEVDLPPETDPHSPQVYEKGRQNFQTVIKLGAMEQDAQPCLYLYRQSLGNFSQTGLVGVASCEEYLRGVIKKHELTRMDKEDDRVRHIDALNAQTGPVFLVHRNGALLDEFIAEKTGRNPDIDFTATDGVRHTSWTISEHGNIEFIQRAFSSVQQLYIADGHHRTAAAARVFKQRNGAGESGYFLAVIFPHDRVQILPYNRVLKDLKGWTPEQILQIFDTAFAFKRDVSPSPTAPHEISFYMRGKWYTLVFREKFQNLEKQKKWDEKSPKEKKDPLEKLDVTLLQEHILKPVFGIDDPRTSGRIRFVGGNRGTAELEKLVNSGEYACAFSLYPTDMNDLIAVADAGKIMPPKSTWFDPKLRDGMFCHLI
jgi:uncharacterized protein (DUF1015 family)